MSIIFSHHKLHRVRWLRGFLPISAERNIRRLLSGLGSIALRELNDQVKKRSVCLSKQAADAFDKLKPGIAKDNFKEIFNRIGYADNRQPPIGMSIKEVTFRLLNTRGMNVYFIIKDRRKKPPCFSKGDRRRVREAQNGVTIAYDAFGCLARVKVADKRVHQNVLICSWFMAYTVRWDISALPERPSDAGQPAQSC